MRRRVVAVSLALCMWWLGGCGEDVYRPGYDRTEGGRVEIVPRGPSMVADPPDSVGVVTVMSVDGGTETWVPW